MKSDAQLKMIAIAAAKKRDKTATNETAAINFDAYNAGTSPNVQIDVIASKENYRVLLDPVSGKVASVTPREKPRDTGR